MSACLQLDKRVESSGFLLCTPPGQQVWRSRMLSLKHHLFDAGGEVCHFGGLQCMSWV